MQFGHTEELVCAGSQTGALKIWDLEAAKIVRTLTGHKGTIRCMDFHPYGDFLTSGSLDTSIKVCKYKHVCLLFEICCIIKDESGSARVTCSVASSSQRCLGLIPGCVLYGIYGGESGTGMGCGLISSPFLCHYCLANAPFPYFIHVPPTLCSPRS